MLYRIIFVLIFCVCGFCGYAQGLQPPQFYLSRADVSRDAKDYYTEGLSKANIHKAYSILDSIFTDNDITRPFYILMACHMLSQAEGELLEELKIISRFTAELQPGTLGDVLFSGEKAYGGYKFQWAKAMASEIRTSCASDLMACFRKSRSEALQHCDEADKMNLETLYNMVRKNLNLFQ